MSTVFSMIQPSGKLGIGHYLGAIRHWKSLQSQSHHCMFAIANLHAITVAQDPDDLRNHTLDLVAFTSPVVLTLRVVLFSYNQT